MTVGDEPQSPARRKLFQRAKELGFTPVERIDLAQYLLRRDITSWKQLDEEQVRRLLDAFEGFELIVHILRDRSGSEDAEADI